MISACGRVALCAALMGAGPSNAMAKVISPNSVTYTYNVDENGEEKLCEMVLDLESTVSPEMVEFTAFAGYSKSDDSIAVGFIAMAATRAKSGEVALVPLSDAAFATETFRSRREMDYAIREDGAVLAATVKDAVAGDFLRAFAGGDFKLTLYIAGRTATTVSYGITEGPTAGVQDSFGACLDQLVPRAVARLRRSAPLPRPFATRQQDRRSPCQSDGRLSG